jgi:hypothetical protein
MMKMVNTFNLAKMIFNQLAGFMMLMETIFKLIKMEVIMIKMVFIYKSFKVDIMMKMVDL